MALYEALPASALQYLKLNIYRNENILDGGMNGAFNFQNNSAGSCLLQVTDIDTVRT